MDLFDLRTWPEFLSAGGSLSSPAYIDQVSIDSRQISSPQTLFVALQGTQDGHSFVEHARNNGAKFALVSHKWHPHQNMDLTGITLLRVFSPLQALQSLAKVYRDTKKAFVIGIAGTYGKTMVKDLLHRMICRKYEVAASPGSYNSQIGVPLSLLTIHQNHEVALIEAAISQKSEMETLASLIKPDATILTLIGKKHLPTLKDIATVEDETFSLLKYTKPGGWALLPRVHSQKAIDLQTYPWDVQTENLPHAYIQNQASDPIWRYSLVFPDALSYEGTITSGFYYFLNLINMAAKAAWLLGVSSRSIVDVIATYQPEPTRTEIWKSEQGAVFINDSYCADPYSVDQALQLFDQQTQGRKIFLFGGMRSKNGQNSISQEYKRIGQTIAQKGVDELLLVGPHPYQELQNEVLLHKPLTTVLHFDTYEAAFETLRPKLTPSDSILIKGDYKIPLERLMQTFNGSIFSNQCTINLDAIKRNIAQVRSHLTPNTRLMTMVKAFAYGTGELQLAKFLNTCAIDILGVSTVDEGVALRKAGVPQAIFVIHAALYEAARVVKWGFEVAVSDAKMIQALAEHAEAEKKIMKVHLHVNTGMARFGCQSVSALTLAKQIENSPFLQLEGVMTHFATADNVMEDAFTLKQVHEFDATLEELSQHGIHPKWKHASNSSAVLRFNFHQYNMVRIGLALYGLAMESTKMELQQALCLTSRIVGINICKKGETISYGRSYTVTREEQRIAILPLGYFDGIHRSYSNKGHVMIRGVRAPMVGKICMDFMMVDISDIPSAEVGDPVLIFGEDEYGQKLPAEEFVKWGNSIVHELITCLGPRIQRLFVYEEKP